jgi:hypothetical protein
MMRNLGVIFLLVLLALGVLSGCYNGNVRNGTLQGTVSIGPIWPVERPGENPPVPAQVFEARKVIVYDEAHANVVSTVPIQQTGQSAKGSYSVQLKPGRYSVDISRGGIDRSGAVPAKVEIKSGQTIILNIDIDTGIR